MFRIVETLRKQRHIGHRIVNNQKAVYSVFYYQMLEKYKERQCLSLSWAVREVQILIFRVNENDP